MNLGYMTTYCPQRFFQQIIIFIGKTANQMHTEEFLYLLAISTWVVSRQSSNMKVRYNYYGVKLQNKGIPDLYIGSFCKLPSMTDESIVQELDKSIYRVKQSPNSHIWLSGDVNLSGINWENGSIRPKASNTKQCKQLLDISHDHALEQMVSKHTYITESPQSTLDYFFLQTTAHS